MSKITFESLGLADSLLRTVRQQGYTHPTPIQERAIPVLLEERDLLGLAQTGTGKTAAFALPTLQLMSERVSRPIPFRPRALILTPTRELAIQVGRSFSVYGKYLSLKEAVIFGGVGQQPQVSALKKGVDILVATPGRLLDLMNQEYCFLDAVEFFTLDEADRMLDMGFIHDVQKIIAHLPRRRQTLFFSATMPPAVEELASTLLTDPETVAVNPVSSTAERIDQKIMFVDKQDKEALLRSILDHPSLYRVLVFTRTKHRANRVAEKLQKNGIPAEAIHGNKSQTARQRALEGFKKGKVVALVATDIAARGIDVQGISHVINFELPNEPESYVHRIGRTARAGADGEAISFCEAEERPLLAEIEKVIGQRIYVDDDHQWHSHNAQNAPTYGHGHKTAREYRDGRLAKGSSKKSGQRGQEGSGSGAPGGKGGKRRSPSGGRPGRPQREGSRRNNGASSTNERSSSSASRGDSGRSSGRSDSGRPAGGGGGAGRPGGKVRRRRSGMKRR